MRVQPTDPNKFDERDARRNRWVACIFKFTPYARLGATQNPKRKKEKQKRQAKIALLTRMSRGSGGSGTLPYSFLHR